MTSPDSGRAGGAGRSPFDPFDPFDVAPATTRRVVRTERLRKPLIAGGVLGVVGLIAALVGGAILYLAQGAEVLAAIGRADVGDPIAFDADDGSYALVFMPSIPNNDGFRRVAMSNLVCDIAGPDGSAQTVRGSRQATALETNFGWSIGSFDAVPGPNEVRCSFARNVGGNLRMYAVAPERAGAKSVASALTTGGLAVGLAGVAMIVYGWRGRSIVEHVPIDPQN